ncbi:MAG: preprotein translocase subunit SecY [Clostridiales bacterium]|jgi:preprotein translocase subunit SecY|nr:preprotein translocase subunit SecY [Clostridiales bacterium]
MFQTLKNAWAIEELRRKILYTLLILFIVRLGCYIPIPGVDVAYVAEQIGASGILGFMSMITGGALGNFTLFALGIGPYITASIIMNLLQVAIPALERLAKEGEEGRRKIAQYTRRFTVVLAFIQAIAIILSLGPKAVTTTNWFNYLTIGLCLTAGAMIVMWLGERITEKGIGNGISLIIFTGIVARVPMQIIALVETAVIDATMIWTIPAFAAFVLVIITGVTFVDLGERRIPVQYAKRVVGRKMYGGQSTHIPMKVNATGVLPLIFAMTLLQFPGMIAGFWPESGFNIWYQAWMGPGTPINLVLMALLIVFFTYFYTTISFNPVEISKNMQQNGGFIPGIRPGKPTSDHLAKISSRITMFGAIFLAVIAVIPSMISSLLGIQIIFGATSVLILVSVALETNKQLDAQMLMRSYKGFLK